MKKKKTRMYLVHGAIWKGQSDMKCRGKKNEIMIPILALVIGLVMAFLVPTWETPDEYNHLWMIGESIGVEGFADKITDSIELEQEKIEFHPEEKVNIRDQKESMVEAPKYTRMEMLPKALHLSIVKHLPATMGIVLGIILGVPAYWVMQLGEIFSLLFYIYVCYLALKIMPIKREMFAMLMLFPMALHQASSINYDATLLPLCYLFVAYVFYLKFEKEEVGIKQVVFAMAIWTIITYIKVPYGLLGMLIFIIPLKKIKINLHIVFVDETFIKRWRASFVAVVCVCGVIGGYLFRNNVYIQVIYGFVREWRRGIYLLTATGKTWTEFLITSTVGDFGWLDTPILYSVAIVAIVVVALTSIIKESDNVNCKLENKDRIVIIITFVLLCLLTTVSLTNHTIMVTLFGSESSTMTYEIREALYQIPYIGGLQGRYYLPFLSLLFIVFPEVVYVEERKKKIVFGMLEMMMYIYVISLLINRYWIA